MTPRSPFVVGMSIDFEVLTREPVRVAGLVEALVARGTGGRTLGGLYAAIAAIAAFAAPPLATLGMMDWMWPLSESLDTFKAR
ncbi:hypothetical protein [Paraburkholderia dipogonis]|uniref:hypothetical protein n=1 Tax=Paraburkholderia dipogonis TaxID=1211383 RepID=UPI0038BC067C